MFGSIGRRFASASTAIVTGLFCPWTAAARPRAMSVIFIRMVNIPRLLGYAGERTAGKGHLAYRSGSADGRDGGHESPTPGARETGVGILPADAAGGERYGATILSFSVASSKRTGVSVRRSPSAYTSIVCGAS